jgi:bifunctional DNA-binding transcriptional regulator/antitoxin component of YhaV-PrlF toxin-antitoxin module
MMRRTVVNAKGQGSIPVELRKRLEIKPGTRVNWSEEQGRLVMAPMTSRRRNEIRGIPQAQARPGVRIGRIVCGNRPRATPRDVVGFNPLCYAFLRPYRFLSTQWQEVLRAFDRLGHFAQQFLQVFVAVDEIDV